MLGCQPEIAPTPFPQPTNPSQALQPIVTPPKTAQPILPTASSTPTPLPPPATPTNIPPEATVALEQPEATLEATAVSPTRSIEGLIGPDNFAENVNPLTGLVVSNPEALQHRPIAIKISNAPPLVRPQAGLNSADLLFEHEAEGGFTRFTAVYYSQNEEVVGSIRSGRLIDLEIPQMYDAAFAYSGSAGLVREMFQDSSFFDRIISPDFAHGGFFRVEDADKPIEHTLFTNSYNLHFLLEQRGQDTPPHFANGMTFREEPIEGGTVATRIELWYEATNATWFYSNGRYLRWTDGNPHLDANTGTQLNFKNVVIVAAHHQTTDILEDTAGAGHYSIQIQIWGEGPVSIFRDGQRFDGRWQRKDSAHMLTFTDLDGNPLPLAPGNTFFQLVPLGFDQLTITP